MTSTTDENALLPVIRERVKERLMNSPAYRTLPREQQVQIAHDTVKALHYIMGGGDNRQLPASVTLGGNASAFAGSPAGGITRPIQSHRLQRNQRDLAGSARAGGEAFTEMVADVNFPAFVGGLIDGVFNSIVTSSIKQMEAYAELVKNVAKSVDEYMKDNVSENNARDFLLDKYPNHLDLDLKADAPRIKTKQGFDEQALPDFFKDLGLPAPVHALDDDTCEQILVPGARRRIAMDRQQLLATMVMMGVNRLVVTNGTIEASCLFELDTTDAQHRNTTSTSDFERRKENNQEWNDDGSSSRSSKSGGGWFSSKSGQAESKGSWYNRGSSKDTTNFKITTVRTADDEQRVQMHAQLGGKVKVNFKSDYFPMEKMIDVLQINQIRDKAAVGLLPADQAAATTPSPALPPMPAVPWVTPPAASTPPRT